MTTRLLTYTAVATTGVVLVLTGLAARDINVPWSSVFPLALLIAYCAGSMVFGRRAA